MIKGQLSGGTKSNILKIIKTLKGAHQDGEEFLTVSRISRMTGIHKWTVSRIIDLYCPYISVRKIEELEALGLQAKMVCLEKPEITNEQALRYLSVRI